MNDFDYDVMQKKRIASGAYHRKGTTNRKGCVLPHELLKPKELKKLNGEIKTVCMTSPVSWSIFKELAPDLQEEYLDTQVRRFGVGLTTIRRELFGFDSDSKLANYVRDNHLTVMSAPPGRQPKAARESWLRWLDGGERVLGRIEFKPTIAPKTETTKEKETDCHGADAPRNDAEEVKPFRAHDFEDMFKEMGMERDLTSTPTKDEEDSENVGFYPLTDLSLTLKGTPIDILTTLRMSFPALLDKDTQYRFTVKVDKFVL